LPLKVFSMLACAVALILLVDISSSVSEKNYELQKRGIAEAFKDPQIQKTIEAQPGGLRFLCMNGPIHQMCPYHGSYLRRKKIWKIYLIKF